MGLYVNFPMNGHDVMYGVILTRCNTHLVCMYREVCVERPMLVGGGQEGGLRGGTESSLLIAALGEAARVSTTERLLPVQLLRKKCRLVSQLRETFENVQQSVSEMQ